MSVNFFPSDYYVHLTYYIFTIVVCSQMATILIQLTTKDHKCNVFLNGLQQQQPASQSAVMCYTYIRSIRRQMYQYLESELKKIGLKNFITMGLIICSHYEYLYISSIRTIIKNFVNRTLIQQVLAQCGFVQCGFGQCRF